MRSEQRWKNYVIVDNPKCYEGPNVSGYEGMRVKIVAVDYKFPHVRDSIDFVSFANGLELFSDVRERVYAFYLDNRNKILGYRLVSAGAVDSTVVDMKVLFGPALMMHARAIAILHNHPSGSLEFSRPDKVLAEVVSKNCKLLEVALLDFVIVAGDSFVSLRDDLPELFL